jgi:hydrogenase expression/formation protein HypC
MCIGLPMQVTDVGSGFAWCEGMGERRKVSTLLVDEQAVGNWLLVFHDTAREVITAKEAARIADALKAVSLTMAGETGVDHLFADLVERGPQLPDFLHPRIGTRTDEN